MSIVMDPWSRSGLLDIGAIRDCIFMQTADTSSWNREDWNALIASLGSIEQIERCCCGYCHRDRVSNGMDLS